MSDRLAPLWKSDQASRPGVYLLALLTVGLATALLYLLRSQINPTAVALLYLLPVGLSTAVWGLWAGIIAALGAFLAFNYFFIQPYYSLLVHQPQDLLVLIVFLAVAFFISQMVGRTKQSLAAATAREQEAIRLYELSTVLAGLHDPQAIADTLSQHILETFVAERVDVFVEAQPGQAAIHAAKASGAPALPGQEPGGQDGRLMLAPLEAARRLMGEIRVVRREEPAPISRERQEAEDRLLRTFASQGVLALERARLVQADTRARVLEESDRMKSSLLSSVSHELRSPLATIKAAATSLRGGAVDWDSEARAELLEAIDEETDHLNQLVGNLLNMSRIEAGALHPQRNWNVLGEIISGVVHRMRHLQHQIKIEIPEDLPLVPVDYMQMEQVFTNLISNSIKYSPEDTTICIRASVEDDRTLRVQVSNQGPGVPEEHLGRIFDKFFRVTAADRVTGTGLGLSICKGIIEAHGGRIWAENLPGGFVFNFTLPLTWEGVFPRIPKE